MAIQNATDIILSVTTGGGTLQAIAFSTSASLSMSMDLRDSTNKSSAGWSQSLGGLKSWEMSSDAFVDIDSPSGADIEELFVSWNTGTEIAVSFGKSGMLYTGNALITSISVDAGVEENATYSISLTGSGELEQNA